MNTKSELIEKGLNERNAERVLESQRKKIGIDHGDYVVVDVNYLSSKEKEVVMECKYCTTKYICVIPSLSGSKWKKMRSRCECQKEAKKEAIRARKELAKAEADRKRQEEIESRVGCEYGEYRIVGIEGNEYLAECKECGEVARWGIDVFPQRRDYRCHAHRRTVERFTEE